MYIIATYNQSLQLEIALTELGEKGIDKERILAVPLKRQQYDFHVFDSIHSADGVSLLGGALAFGTFAMVLGAIYGFILYWGPIVWGLIAFFVAASLWLAGSIVYMKKRQAKELGDDVTSGYIGGDVVLIVHCELAQVELVKQVLTSNRAKAVGILER